MMIREQKGRIKPNMSPRRRDSNGILALWTNHFNKLEDPLVEGLTQSVDSSGTLLERKWKNLLRKMEGTWLHWLIRKLII